MFIVSAGFTSTKRAPEAKSTATRHDMFVEKLAQIPEVAALGPLFKSSSPAELTGQYNERMILFFDEACVLHKILFSRV